MFRAPVACGSHAGGCEDPGMDGAMAGHLLLLWGGAKRTPTSTQSQGGKNLKHLRLGSKAPGHFLSAFPLYGIWFGAVNQNSESVLPRGDRHSREETPKCNK